MEKKQAVRPYKSKKVLLDKKVSLFVYFVVLIIAVILRIIQLKTNMNFAEGRYKNNSFFMNYTVIWLVIGFALIIAALILGKSKDKVIKSCILINPMRLKYDRLNKKISVKAAAPMLAMSLLLAYDMFFALASVVSHNKELSTEENPVSAFSGLGIMDTLIYMCMIVLIITFISVGVNIIKGDGITRGNCFFLAVFPIWELLRIFKLVSDDPIVGVYSEKVYIMLTAMTSAAFILYTIRFFSGYEKKNTRIMMCIFGYVASIFAAVSSIPRYIMLFVTDYDVREGMGAPDTVEVGIIFMTISIVVVFWSTYVYRVMPQLQMKGVGKRRWAAQTALKTMDSVESASED